MRDQNQDKRTLLTIGLVMAVTFLWMYMTPKNTPTPPLPQKIEGKSAPAEVKKSVETKSTEQTSASKSPKVAIKKDIPEETREFKNEQYTATFTNIGGTLKSLKLNKFKTDLKNSSPVEMFDFGQSEQIPILWSFVIGNTKYSTNVPFEMIKADAKSISYKTPLLDDKGKNIADLFITFDMSSVDYQIASKLEISNNTDRDIDLSGNVQLFGKSSKIKGGSSFFSKQEEPVKAVYNLNDQVKREVLDKQVALTPFSGDIKWLGFNDKYFLTAFIPKLPSIRSFSYADNRDTMTFYKGSEAVRSEKIVNAPSNLITLFNAIPKNFEELDYRIERNGNSVLDGKGCSIIEEASGCYGKKQNVLLEIPKNFKIIDDIFSAEIQYPERKIKAGQKIEFAANLFVGPKEIATLKRMGNNMDRAIDLGDWLGPVARPLLYFLKWIYSIIPNYGIAIIILTIIVRMLLYPLTQMQNKSMKKMQRMKPEMDKLKEKYGKDKEALNREMMKMWKIHKVNPMGGCFPMLLQIPIFFALYRVLYNSIELRHTPFMFWIKDLSDYDHLFVMPILMGASFFLQQKMTPQAGVDPAQQTMMKVMMPIMFTVFMLFLPSGLNLYIFISTVLGIIQQWYGMRDKQPLVGKA